MKAKKEKQAGYICDDRPIAMPEEIAKMTDEEVEEEFVKRFRESEYKRICEKLGFEPSEYMAPITGYEDDTWDNPFLVLTSEEIEFLYTSEYVK